MDLSESIELTGQQRGLVFVVGKAYGNSFVGQDNASVLFLRHFDKGRARSSSCSLGLWVCIKCQT